MSSQADLATALETVARLMREERERSNMGGLRQDPRRGLLRPSVEPSVADIVADELGIRDLPVRRVMGSDPWEHLRGNARIIAQLRAEGFKVHVKHIRNNRLTAEKMGGVYYEIDPRGGSTRVSICQVDERDANNVIPLAEGWARCSEKDNYNKKLGLTIALGRALKNLSNAT